MSAPPPAPGPGRPAQEPPSGRSAYLRVYQPLSAFPAADRAALERLIAAGGGLDRMGHALAERAASRLAGVSPTRAVSGDAGGPGDPVVVCEVDGMPHACPTGRRVRTWEAVERLRQSTPAAMLAAYLPPGIVEVAEQRLAAVAGPQLPALARPHLRESTWTVPVAWLLLFDPAERRLRLRAPRSLTYRTAMSQARRRAARALALVRRTLPDTPNLGEIVDVARWLEEFHPYSHVELDYADLVGMFDDESLEEDTSVADLADALAGLREGDGERAFANYSRVVARFRSSELRESVN